MKIIKSFQFMLEKKLCLLNSTNAKQLIRLIGMIESKISISG